MLHYALECFEGMKAYKDTEGRVRLFRPEMVSRPFLSIFLYVRLLCVGLLPPCCLKRLEAVMLCVGSLFVCFCAALAVATVCLLLFACCLRCIWQANERKLASTQ